MDNRISSNIKRALKVTASYFTAFIMTCVLTSCVYFLAGNKTPKVMPWVSFLTFLILFYGVYTEMHSCGFKESRPQYNINPSRFKGLLYGAIGVVPILLVQLVVLCIKVPDQLAVLRWRIFQLVSGPLYWLARLLGNLPRHYFISLVSVIIMAFLGYIAGHCRFYISTWIVQTFGRKRTKNKKA